MKDEGGIRIGLIGANRIGIIAAALAILVIMVLASIAPAIQGAPDVTFSIQVADSCNPSDYYGPASLAVDSHGYAHLVYGKNDGEFKIYYATNRGGTWKTELVDGPFTYYSIDLEPNAWILVDSQDSIHIFYNCVDEMNGVAGNHAKYATRSADSTGNFKISRISSDKEVSIKNVALGPADVISLVCRGSQQYSYVTKTPTGPFVISEIPSTQWAHYGSDGLGISVSLAIASDGNPHIALINSSSVYNATSSNWDDSLVLEYHHRSGGEWKREVVDEKVGMIYFVSIGLNSTNEPRILYGRDAGDDGTPNMMRIGQEVRYVEHSSGGWGTPITIQKYDFTYWVGGSMTVVGDESQFVYISSIPAGSFGALNYSHGNGSSFQTQLVSTNLSGPTPSLAVDQRGGIHLAFWSSSLDLNHPSSLMYVSTGTPIPILSKTQNGGLDLALVLGLVALVAVIAVAVVFIFRRRR